MTACRGWTGFGWEGTCSKGEGLVSPGFRVGRTGFGSFRVGRTGFGWFWLVPLFSNYHGWGGGGRAEIDTNFWMS